MDIAKNLNVNSGQTGHISSQLQNTIAKRVQHYRQVRSMTQSQLAKHSGINYRHLQKIERAHAQVGSDNIEKLAQALRVPSILLMDYSPHCCHSDHNMRWCCLTNGFLDFAPTGISVIDEQGLVIYANRQFQAIADITPLAPLGHVTIWSVLSLNPHSYNPAEGSLEKLKVNLEEELPKAKISRDPTPNRQIRFSFLGDSKSVKSIICVVD